MKQNLTRLFKGSLIFKHCFLTFNSIFQMYMRNSSFSEPKSIRQLIPIATKSQNKKMGTVKIKQEF